MVGWSLNKPSSKAQPLLPPPAVPWPSARSPRRRSPWSPPPPAPPPPAPSPPSSSSPPQWLLLAGAVDPQDEAGVPSLLLLPHSLYHWLPAAHFLLQVFTQTLVRPIQFYHSPTSLTNYTCLTAYDKERGIVELWLAYIEYLESGGDQFPGRVHI